MLNKKQKKKKKNQKKNYKKYRDELKAKSKIAE